MVGEWEDLHYQRVPSGKLTVCYGKSQFLMEKLAICMAMFNSYVTNYQRVTIGKAWENPWENMVIS